VATVHQYFPEKKDHNGKINLLMCEEKVLKYKQAIVDYEIF